MSDANYKVAYQCQWCGLNFHDVDDDHSMHPMPIYNDYEGRQFCSIYCRDMLNDNEELGET